MRVSAQRVSQRSRYACASSSVSKRRPLQRRLLRVADAGFDFPFAIGIADAARQRDDAVVREHVAIERIERGIVDVRREDAFSQVVEDDDADGAAQSTKRALVQLRPDLRARSPHQQPHRLARAAERQDEEARAPVLARAAVADHRALAVVDLAFFAGRGRDDDARLGRRAAAQRHDEAADTRVPRGKAVVVDQVLPDRHGVAATRRAPRRSARDTARRRSRSAPGPGGGGARRVGGHLRARNGRFCRPRVGGHLRGNGRFWFRFARPAAAAHRDAGGLQIAADRLATDAGRLLDAPKRPAQPAEREDLLLSGRRPRRCSCRRRNMRSSPASTSRPLS